MWDTGIETDGLYAQNVAELSGLPDLVNPAHMVKHLEAIYNKNALPFKDEDGKLVGAINLTSSNGGVFGSPKPVFFQQTTDAREVWPL